MNNLSFPPCAGVGTQSECQHKRDEGRMQDVSARDKGKGKAREMPEDDEYGGSYSWCNCASL